MLYLLSLPKTFSQYKPLFFQKMANECLVFYETFGDEGHMCPKLLPCVHAYCYLCLTKLEQNGQIKCPECRIHHHVPEERVGAFPTDTDYSQ